MKIKDLSFYTEIDQESANDINGGLFADGSLGGSEGFINASLEFQTQLLDSAGFSWLADSTLNLGDGLPSINVVPNDFGFG